MIIWQDIVFMVGSLVFAAALIPMLVTKVKPPLQTSIPTSLFLFLFAGSYASLGLWLAAGSSFISACLWATLAFKKGVRA